MAKKPSAKKVIHGRKTTVGWEGPWCQEVGSVVPPALAFWTGAAGTAVTCASCLSVQRKRRAGSSQR